MKIAVLGIGTAGIQTIAHFLSELPEEIEVYSIYDPAHKILGIGESTTTFLPTVLWRGLKLTMLDNYDKLDATTKHGVKYVNWTKENFSTNILPPYHGMHFNNFNLGKVALASAKDVTGFFAIEGAVSNISQTLDCVNLKVDDVEYVFDYIVDCRGYPTDYTDYEMCDYLPVNHCLVNTIDCPGTWNYTYHQATKNGWMFGIPLQTRQGWGYLYNDNITSRDEAIEDMKTLFDDELTLREFAFKNYYKKNIIDGRIISNGNRALFFEPLEALSGTFYEAVGVEALKVILDGKDATESNILLKDIAETYALFISFVYHKGSNFDTKFWKETKEKTQAHLDNSNLWNELTYRINSMTAMNVNPEAMVINPISMSLWKLINDKMNCGVFK